MNIRNPLTIYMNIHADVRVELSILRTVLPKIDPRLQRFRGGRASYKALK